MSIDLKKMFDSEKLTDCMAELYKYEIKGKVYRLIFNMNKNVTIKVTTPGGVTVSEKVGSILAQGSVKAGVIRRVNIDGGMKDAMEDIEEEKLVKYVDLTLKPQSYMDDIGVCLRMWNQHKKSLTEL